MASSGIDEENVFEALGLQLTNIIEDQEQNIADELEEMKSETSVSLPKTRRTARGRNVRLPKKFLDEEDEVMEIPGADFSKEVHIEVHVDLDSDYKSAKKAARGRPKGKAKSSKKGKMPAVLSVSRQKKSANDSDKTSRSRFMFTGNCPLCQTSVNEDELVRHLEEDCAVAADQDDIVIKREKRKKIKINTMAAPTIKKEVYKDRYAFPLKKSACVKRGIPLPNLDSGTSTEPDQMEIDIDVNDTEKAVERIARNMLNDKKGNGTSQGVTKCKLCLKEFTNTRRLREHIRFHIRPWKCDICDKIFQSNTALKYHSAIHTGERKHLCETCGRSFRQSSALISHIRTHTGQRPYPCTMCDKRFTVSSSLYVHMRRHTGTKLHQCDICGMQFHESAPLRYHRNSHTGERPYKCDKCGRAYTRPDKLRLHNCPGVIERYKRIIYQKPEGNGDIEMPTTQIFVATGTNDQTGEKEYQTVEVAWTDLSNLSGQIEPCEQPVVSLVELQQ